MGSESKNVSSSLEKEYCYSEVPDGILGEVNPFLTEGFIDYLKASDHDQVPVRYLIIRVSAYSNRSLHCKNGCGGCSSVV